MNQGRMIKTAVIGVGYLGRFHAQKFASLPESELIGVVDINPEQGKKVSDELDVPFYLNFEEVINKVDAVSIAVPTVHHYKSAKAFLANGVHVLLEKPFAETIEEAEELAQLSSDNNVSLQIGHLERFNPVFVEFQQLIDQPKFIENIRIAPFPKRGTDVDVILDLMIHDIDLVLAAVGEFPETVEGIGVKFVKMRIFQSGLYLSLDYVSGQARKLKVNSSEIPDPEKLHPELVQLEKGDVLMSEIESFLEAIQKKTQPLVSAEDGLNAMKVAWQIKDQL